MKPIRLSILQLNVLIIIILTPAEGAIARNEAVRLSHFEIQILSIVYLSQHINTY